MAMVRDSLNRLDLDSVLRGSKRRQIEDGRRSLLKASFLRYRRPA